MFETAEWDDDDNTPQLSALTWAAARREDGGRSSNTKASDSDAHTDQGRKVQQQKDKLKKTKVKHVSKSKKITDDIGNSRVGCESKINGEASEKVEVSITGKPEKTAGKKKSKRKERKNSALSEISRKVLNSIDSKANSPGEGKALLEDSVNNEVFAEGGDEQLDHPEGEVGSILKKGIKFSSAEAFMRFIGLPGKGKRGKKRCLEEADEEEGGKSENKEKRGKTEEDDRPVEEETSDEEGEENLAFKAETPGVKESDTKALNMGRLKEHLSTQDSKAKDEDAAAQMNKATTDSPLTSAAKQKLTASRFRFLNEQLYRQEGSASASLFKNDPTLFESYHAGYRIQANQWPLDPLDLIIAEVKKLPKKAVVADFGCGEARLAQSVHRATVHSFDLVAANDKVVACDMANVPLEPCSVDVAVFCLALMGTNTRDFIFEASRVLKVGGTLKIAELESRFQGEQYAVDSFVAKVQKFGFKLAAKNLKRDFFYFLDFEKVQDMKKKKKLPDIELKPCLYKKR